METITIKSRGGEHGKNVIAYLESLGGRNEYNCDGTRRYAYYFITKDNQIDYEYGLSDVPNPKLIELPEEKPYPKVMLVSDYATFDSVRWVKRVVFMEKKGKYIAWTDAETIEEAETITDTTTWLYAVDVPEEEEKSKNNKMLLGKISELEKEIKQIKEQIQ